MSDDGEVEPEALEEGTEETGPSEEMAEAPMPAGTPSREPGHGGNFIPPVWR